MRIGIIGSGSGSNMQAILDAIEAKDSTKTTSMRAFSARLRGWTRSGELENVDRGLYQLVRKKK